jgi:hypothetical protein
MKNAFLFLSLLFCISNVFASSENNQNDTESIVGIAMLASAITPGGGLMVTEHWISGISWTVIDMAVLMQLYMNRNDVRHPDFNPLLWGFVLLERAIAIPISIPLANNYKLKHKISLFNNNGIGLQYCVLF